MGLPSSREEIIAALDAYKWNVDSAAEFLMTHSVSEKPKLIPEKKIEVV